MGVSQYDNGGQMRTTSDGEPSRDNKMLKLLPLYAAKIVFLHK